MKKSPTNSGRGKPPSSIRTAFLQSKTRSFLNVDRLGHHLPPSPLANERLMSMSEGPEIIDSLDNAPLKFSSKEVNDCMAHWLTFLKVLKALCVAGSELTDSILSLSMGQSACKEKGPYLKAMWEHLICATSNAAAIVRNQTVTSLQEVVISPDIDADQADTNQQVMCSGLVRLVNVQYQVSVACCEWLGGDTGGGWCGGCGGPGEWDAVARCFAPPRAAITPTPGVSFGRRWSEAPPRSPADQAAAAFAAAAARRWSVPWKLALPAGAAGLQPTSPGDKSRSTTPDTGWQMSLPSQEELQDVISLLSCRPSNCNNPPLPGVILTRASDHHSEPPPRSMMPRGSWMSDCSDDMLDPATHLFRKSSSSTDSSSCYSIHSRSTSGSECMELTQSQQTHLYSMWSGNDVPFIKLPEGSAVTTGDGSEPT